MVAWRQTGEFVNRYFTKGRMAIVDGKLQIRDWTDKNGNKRNTVEVVADSVYFVDSKREIDSSNMSSGYQAPDYGYGAPPFYGGNGQSKFADISDTEDKDLPF